MEKFRAVNFGPYVVLQRRTDNYFEVTKVIKQHNKKSGENLELLTWIRKAETQKLADYLAEHVTQKKPLFDEQSPGSIWLEPLMFFDFACWLSVTMQISVLSSAVYNTGYLKDSRENPRSVSEWSNDINDLPKTANDFKPYFTSSNNESRVKVPETPLDLPDFKEIAEALTKAVRLAGPDLLKAKQDENKTELFFKTFIVQDKKTGLYKFINGQTPDPVLKRVKKDFPDAVLTLEIPTDIKHQLHKNYVQKSLQAPNKTLWYKLDPDDILDIYDIKKGL